MKGRVFTDEHKKHISENHADVKGENNPMYGKTGKESPFYGKCHISESRERQSELRIKYFKAPWLKI